MAEAEADAGTRQRVRVLVCDDDPLARGVVGDVVRAAGGDVIAEADTAVQALLLIDRFEPDVVVLDLNLRAGSGIQVLAALSGRPVQPRVVVFTAYDQIAPTYRPGVDVAYKPDFEGLARCLTSLTERPVERRRPGRRLPGTLRPTIDDAPGFYRVLGQALPGDVLVSVRCASDDPEELARILRRAVRAQDRVHQRTGDVLVLLVGGGEEAVVALRSRLEADVHDVAARLQAVGVGSDPTDAFDRLTC